MHCYWCFNLVSYKWSQFIFNIRSKYFSLLSERFSLKHLNTQPFQSLQRLLLVCSQCCSLPFTTCITPFGAGHHLSIFDPYDSLDGIVSWVRTSSLSNTGNWLNWTDLPFQSHLTLSASVREWEQECDLALLKITLDKHSNLCLSGQYKYQVLSEWFLPKHPNCLFEGEPGWKKTVDWDRLWFGLENQGTGRERERSELFSFIGDYWKISVKNIRLPFVLVYVVFLGGCYTLMKDTPKSHMQAFSSARSLSVAVVLYIGAVTQGCILYSRRLYNQSCLALVLGRLSVQVCHILWLSYLLFDLIYAYGQACPDCSIFNYCSLCSSPWRRWSLTRRAFSHCHWSTWFLGCAACHYTCWFK